ncbi:putative zingipain [Helianthus debilis subsp. tardiflorus]
MIDQRRKGKTESFKSDRPADVLPESVDWRERGVVAPVKDQGTCGGSWAFSTIGSVEAVHHITTGELITLSEQQLLDCDTSCNKGCNGGDKDHAFAFILESGGIHAADDYPYTGKDEGCYALASKDVTLSDDMASMDLATDENLENLVEAGEKLLKKPVTRMNFVTGEIEHDPRITNEMVIQSFATTLRDIYLAKSEMDKEEHDE